MWRPSFLLLAIGCAFARPVAESSPSSASERSLDRVTRCATLGFDVDALDCRLCDEFSTFLTSSTSNDTSKIKKKNAVERVCQECRDCCSDFSKVREAEGRRYAKAVLAVSQYRLKWYPKVATFVENQAAQFKRLQVEDTNARLPMLQLYDDVGDKVEEISVAYWDEKSIAEFIDNKLVHDKDMTNDEDEGKEGNEILEMEVAAESL